MDEEEEHHCAICTEKVQMLPVGRDGQRRDYCEYDGHTPVKTGCGHIFHQRCLFERIRALENHKEPCPNCNRLIETMQIWKRDEAGEYEWHNQPIDYIEAKIPLAVTQRPAVTCDIATEKRCFVCFSSDTTNTIECDLCCEYCHRDCYPTEMIYSDDGWVCNWCHLYSMPIFPRNDFWVDNRFQRGNPANQFKIVEPILPTKFIEKAKRMWSNRIPQNRGETLLTYLGESIVSTVRRLRNRTIIVYDKDEVKEGDDRETLNFTFLPL